MLKHYKTIQVFYYRYFIMAEQDMKFWFRSTALGMKKPKRLGRKNS